MTPPPPISRDQVEVLTSLLDSKGLDAGDLLDAIQLLASAKKASGKVPDASADESGRKIFQEKEFIYPGITDAWIYRNGQTKSKSWYLRVKSPGQTPFVKSLGRNVQTREQALVAGQLLYQEVKGKVARGEKRVSIKTSQLIKRYLDNEAKQITNIPKAGITPETYATKKSYLAIWEEFIKSKKMNKKNIEAINPELGKEFAFWLQGKKKGAYKDKPYSPEYINSVVSETKRMYLKFAVEEGFISPNLTPKFKSLRVPKDQAHKRDILTAEEWNRLTVYMRSNKYLKGQRISLDGSVRMTRDKKTGEEIPVPITHLEQVKRQIFREFILIAYSTGDRPGSLLKMTWGDVSINNMDTKENQQTHRLLKVRAENSKTGVSRVINAPVARRLERLQKAYASIGMECEPHHYIFRNPTPARKDSNIAFGQPAFTKRLENILLWSGIQEELDKTNRKIVLYSSRHFYVTIRLENGVNIHQLSRQIGSSVHYIESTYSHVETAKSTEELTKGIGFIKRLEEQD